MSLSLVAAILISATQMQADIGARAEADRLIAMCRDALDDDDGVSVVERTMCFSGHTEAPTLDAFRKADAAVYDQVVLRSAGGDVETALMIAERWLERGLERVIVWDYCLSSCANWLFLAGETKIQKSPSVIAWHGGPGRPESLTPEQEPYREALTELYERSEAFYEAVNVDSSIMYTVPDGAQFDYDNPTMSFWIAPREVLEAAGVKGLVIYDGVPQGEGSISFTIR